MVYFNKHAVLYLVWFTIYCTSSRRSEGGSVYKVGTQVYFSVGNMLAFLICGYFDGFNLIVNSWLLCSDMTYAQDPVDTFNGLINLLLCTQQNSYSISHLLGTVTRQWLPLWRCSHCSLVPDTVTTEQWLHRTHMLLGIHYHGTYVEICRHLVGNCTVTTWEDTRYPLFTVTV